MSVGARLAESGLLPDFAIRVGIRKLIRQRLREESRNPLRRQALLKELSDGPISRASAHANAQHYEVPAAFFQAVLGPHMKYSACYWSPEAEHLADAEQAMLETVAERARLADGQDILDLGCGWGSLALWAAERYPSSRVVAVSNSASQKAYIDATAAQRGIDNLATLTADVNDFEPGRAFDRIVSVELFEHLRNYEALLKRISGWLVADGRLFVHVFCHNKLLYAFEDEGAGNWMGREFFTGGLMPASDTLPAFQTDLRLERQWHVNGRHYRDTARAWLDNLDRNRAAAKSALAGMPPKPKRRELERRVQRWRMFFMACEELFGFDRASQWEVCHYLFAPRTPLAEETSLAPQPGHVDDETA